MPTLSRSLAHGSSSRFAGSPTRFPAMLRASAHGAVLARRRYRRRPMRLTQAMHALAMSLIALPDLPARAGVLGSTDVAGARSCAVVHARTARPSSSPRTSRPTRSGYPLALHARRGVRAAGRAHAGDRKLGFLALAGLATFTRMQYVVLVPAFVVAALVMTRRAAARGQSGATRSSQSSLVAPAHSARRRCSGRAASLGYYRRHLRFQRVDITSDAGQWVALRRMMLLALRVGFRPRFRRLS